MESPSSRRAWIEIFVVQLADCVYAVALLAEGVDRNRSHHDVLEFGQIVALLAEGVDRNLQMLFIQKTKKESPSSRRAWIEIPNGKTKWRSAIVALLAEGVDRNKAKSDKTFFQKPSPSSRRAWIEIETRTWTIRPSTSPSSRRAWIEMKKQRRTSAMAFVALLAEGVDRNRLAPRVVVVLA